MTPNARRALVILFIVIAALAVVRRNARIRAFKRWRQSVAAAEPIASPLATIGQSGECKTAVGYRVMHINGRVVAVWYPTTASPTPYQYSSRFSSMLAENAAPSSACGSPAPLVVFSHGDLGCGIQSVALTEELAHNGYVVAAPDHADAALCHTVPPPNGARAPQPAQPKILDPAAWDETSRVDRRDDIEAIINELLREEPFRGVIDPGKIGLAGHSLGGYTVVGIAGGWQSWLDPRVRAVLALSPYVMPFQVKKTLGNVHVPLMYQGGTLDVGITPFLIGPNGAFTAANPPAYFVELRSAAHLAWTNCGDERTTESCLDHVTNARLITQYGVAFFDHYLKGLDEPILKQANPLLADYRFKP